MQIFSICSLDIIEVTSIKSRQTHLTCISCPHKMTITSHILTSHNGNFVYVELSLSPYKNHLVWVFSLCAHEGTLEMFVKLFAPPYRSPHMDILTLCMWGHFGVCMLSCTPHHTKVISHRHSQLTCSSPHENNIFHLT